MSLLLLLPPPKSSPPPQDPFPVCEMTLSLSLMAEDSLSIADSGADDGLTLSLLTEDSLAIAGVGADDGLSASAPGADEQLAIYGINPC